MVERAHVAVPGNEHDAAKDQRNPQPRNPLSHVVAVGTAAQGEPTAHAGKQEQQWEHPLNAEQHVEGRAEGRLFVLDRTCRVEIENVRDVPEEDRQHHSTRNQSMAYRRGRLMGGGHFGTLVILGPTQRGWSNDRDAGDVEHIARLRRCLTDAPHGGYSVSSDDCWAASVASKCCRASNSIARMSRHRAPGRGETDQPSDPCVPGHPRRFTPCAVPPALSSMRTRRPYTARRR